ncbi:MAG TPA: CinA family nicotinamide mononucleotide deamidase-related protein [Chthoniobacterales bacterium]
MRTIILNTGTELLLGDVVNAHLAFVAREILKFGLRIDEQRTVPDGDAIRLALQEVFSRAEIVFVTGGLGPTTDDITREIVAQLLELELVEDATVREAIQSRLSLRRIPMTNRVWRQAKVPIGAEVLPNQRGTAPGLYLRAKINPHIASPHLFLLPGPPRELEPIFYEAVAPILRRIAEGIAKPVIRKFRLAVTGESIVEKKVGAKILAIPGIELGYCARPGEVDLRVIGTSTAVEKAGEIVENQLKDAIFTTNDENLADVIVRLLRNRRETLATAESCTGGLLAHLITNVPGASKVFLAGHIVYSNEEKVRALGVSRAAIEGFGAVSEEVAREMAEATRSISGVTHAIATTGIAGPEGGTADKPVGTAFVALASANQPTLVQKLFVPSDRETFKQLVAQNAFDLLRKRLLT